MGFLKNVCAFLTTEIPVSLAIPQLKDHNGMFRVNVPAANRVLLYHA